jgi:hypothetical protein
MTSDWLPPRDPASELDPATILEWPGLLTADVDTRWSVSSLRRTRGPMRVFDGGALLEEEPFALLRAVVPQRALDPGENTHLPVADRLRLRFRNQLPYGSALTTEGEPCRIGSLPGTCDRFSDGYNGPLRAFVAAAATGESDPTGSPTGVVVLVSGPSGRYDTVAGTGWSLATAGTPRSWVRVAGWWWQETLQLDAGDRIATVSLEQVHDDDLDQWTGQVFARAPYLRGMRSLGERDVRVGGLTRARMHRFDWQPSGRGRMLTNLVVGVRGDLGFQLVMELPFHDDAALGVTLDDLLPALRVEAV